MQKTSEATPPDRQRSEPAPLLVSLAAASLLRIRRTGLTDCLSESTIPSHLSSPEFPQRFRLICEIFADSPLHPITRKVPTARQWLRILEVSIFLGEVDSLTRHSDFMEFQFQREPYGFRKPL